MKATNPIIEKLQSHGYNNTGDNRSYDIRSLNTLLSCGILDLIILDCQRYKTHSFKYDYDGKIRTTAYKIKIFGKTYFGHWMPKKKTERSFGESWLSDIEYNSINLYDMLCKVANILNSNKNGFDFLKDGYCDCAKCSGKGVIPSFAHYANGVCFDCAGTGINSSILKNYISSNLQSITE